MAKKKSKIGIVILIALILGLGGIVVYHAAFKDKDLLKVQVTEVKAETIKQIITATGKIRPETEVKVSSETSGEIVFLGVEEGDTVKKNQILVRIRPDIIKTRLEQASAVVEASEKQVEISKTDLERIEKDYRRMKDLYEKKFVSRQEFDAVDASYKTAQSSLEAAKSRYKQSMASYRLVKRDEDRTSIYAPIDGIVTRLNVEIGEKVVGTGMMAGTELLVVSDMNVLNAEVDVDENDIVLVAKGDTAEIELDAYPDRIFKGTVFEIGHSANIGAMGGQDQVTNFLVKIRLHESEAGIRPGMSCNADIQTDVRYDVPAVPLQAVTVNKTEGFDATPDVDESAEGGPGFGKVSEEKETETKKSDPDMLVFLYENGKAVRKVVKTGISNKGSIEITEGLSEGDSVISGPFSLINNTLKGGEEVEIDSNFYNFKAK